MEPEKESKQPLDKPPLMTQSYPLLLVRHGKDLEKHTFFSISQDRYHTRMIPEMQNTRLCCSSVYGWLVLEKYETNELFLLNLKSMEKIRLPSLGDEDSSICFLTSPPGSPDSYVLFICGDTFRFCQPGDQVFKETYKENSFRCMIPVQGKIYALELEGELVVIEFENSTLKFTTLFQRKLLVELPHEVMYFSTYLVEFSGEIFHIRKLTIGFTGKTFDFMIYKLDSNTSWVRVESLGPNTIFLQGTSFSTCCVPVESNFKRNSIYFYENEDRHLYVFDVSDRSISMQLPCPKAHKTNSVLRWVMFPGDDISD